jgi:hypothetical protein
LAILPKHSGRFAKIWFQNIETMKASGLRWTKASANSIIGETNNWYCNTTLPFYPHSMTSRSVNILMQTVF